MIPICIQTIENDDDRDFMEWLFLEYHPLMYATIRKVIHDQWTCEDVLQESVRKFIDHIPPAAGDGRSLPHQLHRCGVPA